MEHLIKNPIIPGFYPDPSICRVGDDYYIANSSFELCPGIPIFHSKDLAHWKQIGYAMTTENGFYTDANLYSGGVMAPTIRYHKGTFYIINCNFGDKGNFIVTAKDPKGPWSQPHYITDIQDIDCSIFFDDDDKCYLVSPGEDKEQDNNRAFYLTPYDIENFKVCGERKKIWNSAMRGAWAPESPHIYHVGDYYYLMIAEGGTEHNHSVMIARSKTIDGWYEGNPANPILTHRHLGWDYPIENIGHADLVETQTGKWYAVMLGVRIIEGQHMNMGRETFICPVDWQRGWPVFSKDTGKVETTYQADPDLPWCEESENATYVSRDDFDSAELGMDWSFWGTPSEKYFSVENSELRLKCLARPMTRELLPVSFAPKTKKDENVAFVGRRQRHMDFSFEISMEFNAGINEGRSESAGMVIMQQCNHQYRFEKSCRNGKQILSLVLATTKQKGLPFMPGYESETTESILKECELEFDGPVILKLEANGQDYSFYMGQSADSLTEFYAHADGKKINPEEVGGMVGTMLGMFATGNGNGSDNLAKFEYAEYRGN
ncbi:glycoside hydrolase family 43 protein [Butyrivibrio sp. AE3004]|uniref:glycoside hydrolase family 43 protein n=1 Tax=Butyrivibrio sp. AE3004 TaxID=1506994 RepID=UPI000493B970|nr:glycoside hydrolase family 43 protein [Butyrivibrio sp. AE3004]